MMKLSGFFLAAALVSGAYAEGMSEGDRILGIELGYSTIQADTGGTFGETDHRSSNISYGMRLGAEETVWRTLLSVDYYDNTDDDQQYFKGLAEVSYFVIQDSSVKPFIGLNVGYLNYQSTDYDENALLYGGQVGVTFRAGEHAEIDLSYRYSFSQNDKIDHVEGVVLGLNYIF